MHIGYLMNIYPAPSGTFIRREIRALEAQGVRVSRFAIRRFPEPLVDAQDREEQARTRYILAGQGARLVAGFFAELVTNPGGLLRVLPTWWRLNRNAQGRTIHHVAYLLEAIALRRLARAGGIGHIHAHFSTNAAAVALLCHRLGGPGYSFTAHGPDEFIDWGRSSLALKVAGARFVAAISHFCTVQLMLAAGSEHRDRIHIVRCGLDMEDFAVSEAPFDAQAPFDSQAPFVCVGRLCPQKAQVLIVEAVAQVARTRPDVRVTFIGDGESRAEVEAAIARHGLQDNIDLLGWCDNATVRDHVARARAFLLPSFAEGLPVAIMEAFALGRPVISTYIAGIPELVDDSCGWVIPAGSPDHIATAMTAAMETTPERLAAMGREGRRRVGAQHDIRKSAGILRHVFGDVAGTPENTRAASTGSTPDRS